MGVMENVKPFMAIYLFWIAFFATISAILGSNANNAEGFEGVPLSFSFFLVTFENSLGNISSPTILFLKGKDVLSTYDRLYVGVIYIFWFMA